MKIRYFVIAIIAGTLLPLLILAAVTIVTLARQHEEYAERSMLDTTRALSLAVDRELIASIRALEVLAADDSLDSGDLERFYGQAARALKSFPKWETILLLDTTAQQLINLRRPFGVPLPPPRTTSPLGCASVDGIAASGSTRWRAARARSRWAISTTSLASGSGRWRPVDCGSSNSFTNTSRPWVRRRSTSAGIRWACRPGSLTMTYWR